MLPTIRSFVPANTIECCVFCGKQSSQIHRHHSVHNEDPLLKINFLGTLLTANSVPNKGYSCPFATCPFVGLPAALYTHILTHVQIIPVHANAPAPGITPQKRALEDTLSPYTDTLVGGTPSPNTLAFERPTIQLSENDASPSPTNYSHGDGETPVKKKRPLPETPLTPPPGTLLIPNDLETKIRLLESYMNDQAGVCALHGLSSSLPILEPHTDLRSCDLVNASYYRGHYRKTIRRYINKPTLCSSCGGCKRFEHPVKACDNDSLQDFWLGIPYLVFTIPAISRVIFDILRVQNHHNITHSIESFGTWLYSPSNNSDVISMGNPKLYDLLFAFFQSTSRFSTIDWKVATREAATRVTSLQTL